MKTRLTRKRGGEGAPEGTLPLAGEAPLFAASWGRPLLSSAPSSPQSYTWEEEGTMQSKATHPWNVGEEHTSIPQRF